MPVPKMPDAFETIPVIDIAGFLAGTDRTTAPAQIHDALTRVGFFTLTGHGVAPGRVRAMFAAARALFALPLEAKMDLHLAKSGQAFRGYLPLFGENTDPTVTRDMKESFDLGLEAPDSATPFFGANPWPPGLPGFRDAAYGYFLEMRALALRLMGAIAVSLALPEDHFAPRMTNPIGIQRMIHYPAASRQDRATATGAGAHTDYGMLTILAQDAVGGLEVLNRDGAWIPVPPVANSVVINIGDVLQRLTNDVYFANLHRVTNTSGRERYSLPFFFDADFDAVFEPLATCVTPDRPARHGPIHSGPHKLDRYRGALA